MRKEIKAALVLTVIIVFGHCHLETEADDVMFVFQGSVPRS